MKKVIPYYRVSTDRQGESGLGLEAQQRLVHEFARINGMQLIQEFVEVESSKNDKRPLLQNALLACEKEKAILLIAKLDRLSRKVALSLRLYSQG